MPAPSPRPLGVTRPGRVLVWAAGALLLFGLLTACNDQETPANETQVNMKTVVIPVEGMSCMACAARVKKTLRALAGVGDVRVSLAERNARVRFDPSRLAPDRLVTAIGGLGYYAGTPREVP